MATQALELYVVVDDCGNYACGSSREAAVERYQEDVGELADAEAVRWIRATLDVELPAVTQLTAAVLLDPRQGATLKAD